MMRQWDHNVPAWTPWRRILSEDHGGFVGIGTGSPDYRLHVRNGMIGIINDNGDNAQLKLSSGQGDVLFYEGSTLAVLLRIDTDLDGGTFNLQNRIGGATSRLYIDGIGNIGIGTTTPINELDVNGTIRANEVIVETGWADDVFGDDYALRTLAEVKSHIEKHRRLPGMPSDEEVAANGVSVGDTQRLLLEKVEELTLYVIELKRENAQIQASNAGYLQRLESLERSVGGTTRQEVK